MTADPEWREFEKLVAQIEESLAPKGVSLHRQIGSLT